MLDKLIIAVGGRGGAGGVLGVVFEPVVVPISHQEAVGRRGLPLPVMVVAAADHGLVDFGDVGGPRCHGSE